MSERIGLTAVLELGAFSKAVQTYNQAVSGMSKNTTSAASSISSSFVGLGSGILKVGAIAAGAGLAGVAALTAGLVILGSTALTEFAKYERMSLSIQSLVARDLAQGKLVEQQRTVAISLTKKEAQELDGLAGKIHDEELARNTLHARIKEQSESLRQLREAHGEEALDVQTATARLAELENQYNKSGAEIQGYKDRQVELTNKTGEYTTVLEKVRTGQMSMTEAMAQAGPKAAELLTWISKLAIQSPFTEEGVNLAFQTALAYGFNVDEAKRLTEAEVDYAAATGKSVDTTNLIALALGQMQAKGKVSGQEIIQLTNAGVGVNKILEDMGFTLDDVSAGLVDSDKFIEAVIKDMEIFDGAAASQANTFSGLISTLSDLKAIGLREFFTGTFTAIQPYLANFVGMLTSAALETGSIRQLGDAFGTYVAQGIASVVTMVTKLSGAFSRFGVRGAAVSLMGMLGFSQEEIGTVSSVIRTVTAEITRLQGVFQKFGASGVAFSIGGLLGLDSDTMIMIQQTLTQIIASVSNFATQVQSFLGQMGIEELQGALLAIGGIVAGGVFAAIVAGIASLMTPFTLLTGAVIAFSVAWAGNWGNVQGIVLPIIDTVIQSLNTLWAIFQQFGAMGATVSLLSMLGLSSETIGLITVGVQSIQDAFTNLSNWWIANWPIMQAVAMTAWTVIQGVFAGFQNVAIVVSAQLQQSFNNINQGLSNLGLKWSDVWNALKTATGIVLAAIGVLLLGAVSAVGGLATATGAAISTITSIWQTLMAQVTTIITGITQALVGVGQIWTGIISGDWAQAWQGYILVAQGAVNTIKGMLGTLVTLFAAPFAIILETAKGFVVGVIAVFTGLYDTLVGNSIIPDMVNEIVKWFKGLPQKILSGLSDLASKISAPFEKVQETIHEVLNVDDWITLGGDLMAGLLEGITANADKVLEFLKNLAYDSLASLKGIWMSSSPSKAFADEAKNAMDGLVKGVTDNATQVTKTFGNLGQSAINSLMTGMKVTDSGFIHDFIDDLNMGGIARAAGTGGGQWRNFRNILINEITAGMSGLEAGGINFMAKITEVANRFHFPPNLAREFAQAEGLVEHLTGTFGVMFQKLRIENLSSSISLASQFAGIGASFADMVKEQEASLDKLKENTSKATEDLAKLKTEESKLELDATKANTELENQATKLSILRTELEQLTTAEGANQIAVDKKKLAIEKLTESLEFGQRQLEIYKRELATEVEGTLDFDKKKLQIDRLTESMDAQEKQLVTLKEELAKLTAGQELDTVAIEKKQLEIEKLIQAMDANKQSILENQQALEANQKAIVASEKALADYRKELGRVISAGNTNINPLATQEEQLANDLAMIELLQKFLDSGVESLRLYGDETEGIFAGTGLSGLFTRVYAQEELNRLLAEQAERQQEILDIEKAQKQLDFLGQQLNLMKMLSDRGLNPRDILGGITLGVNASAQGLLEATNRVVQAMVNQINSDLQIASPSKVMARIGGQVIAGMAFGMERGQSLLSNAVRSIPILNGSIPQPVFSQAGGVSSSSSTTYNYNFPMTVNTAATAPAVVRQYEIKRSMYAN